jgi:hypothetical protein
MAARCHYCNAHVEPGSRHIYRRVTGWEHRADIHSSRRGGADVVLREHVDEYACPACIQLLKSGVNPKQGALL